jgi:hypothetical protein
MALLTTLLTAAKPSTADGVRGTIFGAARGLLSHANWPSKLVHVLLAIHSMSAHDRVRAVYAMEDSPEQGFPSTVNGLCASMCMPEWRTHLCTEAVAHNPEGGITSLSVASVAGVEILARVLGPPLVDGLRAPLQAWHNLDEVRPLLCSARRSLSACLSSCLGVPALRLVQ